MIKRNWFFLIGVSQKKTSVAQRGEAKACPTILFFSQTAFWLYVIFITVLFVSIDSQNIERFTCMKINVSKLIFFLLWAFFTSEKCIACVNKDKRRFLLSTDFLHMCTCFILIIIGTNSDVNQFFWSMTRENDHDNLSV